MRYDAVKSRKPDDGGADSTHRRGAFAHLARPTGLLVLVIGGLISVLPIGWMIITSLKPSTVPANQLLFSPTQLSLDNYRELFARIPVIRLVANTVLIAGSVLGLQLLVNIPAAYALSRFRFRGQRLLWWLIVMTLMVPIQATILPVYVLFAKLGLTNTYTSVVIPFAASGFAVFLFYQYFRNVPPSLIDAARMDGLSEARIAWQIVVPIAKPAIIAFSIFSAVTHWNSFFWPLMMLSGLDRAPLTFGLAWFSDAEAGANWGGQMALATVAVTPLLVAFVFAQRRFVEGIAMSGIKG
jgi:multiple sugar transport system permease protein